MDKFKYCVITRRIYFEKVSSAHWRKISETLYTMPLNHHILAVRNKFDSYFVSKYFAPNIENALIIGKLSSLLSS